MIISFAIKRHIIQDWGRLFAARKVLIFARVACLIVLLGNMWRSFVAGTAMQVSSRMWYWLGVIGPVLVLAAHRAKDIMHTMQLINRVFGGHPWHQ